MALTELSETAREAERVLGTDGSDRDPTDVHLARLVKAVFEAVSRGFPAAAFKRDLPEDLVVEAERERLRLVLTHLVENAVAHNDTGEPVVRVTATFEPDRQYPLTVSVADNGPGIPPTSGP